MRKCFLENVSISLASRAKGMLKNVKILFVIVIAALMFVVGLTFVFETTVAIGFLLIGMALLAISSEKAVEHSVGFATTLKISPLMIGLVVVSLGTDFPEIVNSIISSSIGHIDINVGDSFGSALTQMTLVLGLLPFLGGEFKVKREQVSVMGACAVLAFIVSVSIVQSGYISRMNALFLVVSWPLLMLISRSIMKSTPTLTLTDRSFRKDIFFAVLGFIGVAIGAYITINSVIALSTSISIPEYYLSFFLVAIGTSLPEIMVDRAALRNKQYEVAIGDVIGSSIVDAGFSIGIGTLLFPGTVTASFAEKTGLYAMISSIIVVTTLALRQRHDKKSGLFFILLYALVYLLILVF